MTATLAENRYERKRYAVNGLFGQLCGMAARKKRELKPPKNDLHKLFLRRVQEELDAKHLSRNGLAARVGGPSQTTLNDIMRGANPRIEAVSEIATALGIPAWKLFIEKSDIVERGEPAKVTKLPAYPEMIGRKDKEGRTIGKTLSDRKKRRA